MPPQAPWAPLFQAHIAHLKPCTFTLATQSASPSPTSSLYPMPSPPPLRNPPGPRCRTMIYRGSLCQLPENRHNPLQNARAWDSDLPTFTTDARMAKAVDAGTTGGAEVEACFWAADETQNQWRIQGRCYLLSEMSPEPPTAVTERLRRQARGLGESEFSWRKEVQAHFGNLTPAMRGSFANPPPGAPLGSDVGGLVMGGTVENRDLLAEHGIAKIARDNFRVGVIVPDVVEHVNLGAAGGCARRWVWWWVGEGAEGENVHAGWRVCETYP